MTADPFPGRCRKCGLGLLEDTDDCGRGAACRSELRQLRDWLAAGCSRLLRLARRWGLVE
jgi:hypothetical protein